MLKRLFLVLVALLALLLVAGGLSLGLVSAGGMGQIVDHEGRRVPGSVATAEQISLGGVEQFVMIRGRRRDNPVLLVLHGGPGDAEAAVFQYYNRELEDHFVVVHWDQRGAGRSYSRDIPPETMTVDQLVADAHELTRLLAARFGVEQVLVMGHSWGSYLGLRLVHRHPSDYVAFVGIGQVADQAESERRSFAWALEQAREQSNEAAARALEQVGPPVRGRYLGGLAGLGTQRRWIRAFGGAAHGRGNLEALSMIAWPTLVFSGYRVIDKLHYLEAEAFSMGHLEEPMLDDPPAATMLEFDVPIFVLQGRHDHQTELAVARQYFDALQAPHKEMVVFERAAHLVPFEQPDRFLEVMLERVRPWALPRFSPADPR